MVIALKKTKDIAAALGKVKSGRVLVGFALETDNGMENALGKLRKKNLDFIVLNSVGDGVGFGYDTNRVTVIHADGRVEEFPLKDKREVAVDIVDGMERYLSGRSV